MQINVGTPDRIARLILGVVLLVLPFIADFSPLGTWASVIVGIVMIVTAVLRYCPAYTLFGIRTGGGK